jgi:hypothetical protein
MNEATMQTTTTTTLAPIRTRRGKKRLVFQPPRQMPPSVRALWETASPEEKERAHRSCVAILSMWLGRKTRQAVAQELELPRLRVWQLSQSALSGMLAGLLKQPRGRGKGTPSMQSDQEDPRALRKRIAELEEENRSLRDLVEVLRNLPSAREPAQLPRKKKPEKKKTRGRRIGPTKVLRLGEAGSGDDAQEQGTSAPR